MTWRGMGVLTLAGVGLCVGSWVSGWASEKAKPPTADQPSASPPISVNVNDWPWWRGPRFDSKAQGTGPVEWSETRNIVWKTPIPGRAHSTPSVCGDRIFLTTADEEAEVQSLLCLDRSTGKELWATPIHRSHFDHMHEKNSQASSTPACDGERVYTSFLNNKAIWVTAVDLEGKIVWQRPAGEFTSLHGYGASPLLYRDRVIVAGDNNVSGFLAALRRSDGEELWKIERPLRTSFSSPIIGQFGGRDQVLLPGCGLVTGIDPQDGTAIWTCDGTSRSTASTVVVDGDRLFTSGGLPKPLTLSLRGDGRGDVTETHVVWRSKNKVNIPSLLVNDGLLYTVNDGGVAVCWNSETGEEIWKERLGGDFSASLVQAGELLYVPNEQGQTFVLRAGKEFELVATNELAEGALASPVICGGRLYLRTEHHLYCIATEL